ncbi:MAG: shikimate kinase, partial [Mesorhizobium sp.]
MRTVFSTPQGYRFEVEFHTPASYQAKLANHDLYKQIGRLRRHPEPDAVQKATELVQSVKDRCLEVAIPPDVASIPHWGLPQDRRSRAAGAFSLPAAERASQPAAARSARAVEIMAALGTRPIVLVGMPGSGKSTIGPELARKLGLEFVDTDKHIEARHGKLADLFQRHGEAHFRALEAEQIAGLLENGPCVIATGGGAFAQQHNRSLIVEKAVSVWLDTNPQVIRMRLRNDTSRPLLQGPDGNDKLSRMFEERTPLYQQADIRVVPPHRQDKKNAEPCVKALHAYLCGGEDEAAPTPANKAPAANDM